MDAVPPHQALRPLRTPTARRTPALRLRSGTATALLLATLLLAPASQAASTDSDSIDLKALQATLDQGVADGWLSTNLAQDLANLARGVGTDQRFELFERYLHELGLAPAAAPSAPTLDASATAGWPEAPVGAAGATLALDCNQLCRNLWDTCKALCDRIADICHSITLASTQASAANICDTWQYQCVQICEVLYGLCHTVCRTLQKILDTIPTATFSQPALAAPDRPAVTIQAPTSAPGFHALAGSTGT